MTRKRDPVQVFRDNLKAVEDLMVFDRQVLDFLSASLTSLKQRLVKLEATSPYIQPDKLITTIAQIREHNSLRPYYEVMYNQCLVLIVSHFASAVRDLFVAGVAEAAETLNRAVVEENVRIKVELLLDESVDRSTLVAEAIADAGDQSWQDMQSISRAYTKYFGRAPERDSVVNDIIVAQAVRHVIVHSGAKVDRRLLSQIKNAAPRSFRPDLVLNQQMQLSPEHVRLCGTSMTTYLQRLAAIVREAVIEP